MTNPKNIETVEDIEKDKCSKCKDPVAIQGDYWFVQGFFCQKCSDFIIKGLDERFTETIRKNLKEEFKNDYERDKFALSLYK